MKPAEHPWTPALEWADLTGGVPVLSVTGVATYLQDLIQADPYLTQLWVVGEVSSYTPHRNGHVFITLADPQTGDTLKAVVWSSQVPRLHYLPTIGQQIIVLGQIRTYIKTSVLQCQVWQILPAGEGLLALRYQQLKQRLTAEGLFDPESKQAIPAYPECVGVVSSPQAAGWGDIQRTTQSRYPGFHLLLSPAIVQGDRAPESIVQAIQRIERDGRAEVLIIARGGGSQDDLSCFNDEQVVRAIVQCSIPIVTGIGHQRDETLADLAADYCAHTPTAAAEYVIPHLEQLLQAQHQLQADLIGNIQSHLQQHRQCLIDLQNTLQRLKLGAQLGQHQVHIQQLRHRLVQAIHLQLQQAQYHHQALAHHLQALDPQAVLNRGYAIVRSDSGEWIRSAHIEPGTPLIIELSSGLLRVRVES